MSVKSDAASVAHRTRSHQALPDSRRVDTEDPESECEANVSGVNQTIRLRLSEDNLRTNMADADTETTDHDDRVSIRNGTRRRPFQTHFRISDIIEDPPEALGTSATSGEAEL